MKFSRRGDIRLLSCDAGSGTGTLAQNLSNQLGVKVKAANTSINVYPNGFLELEFGGTWKIFTPGGQ